MTPKERMDLARLQLKWLEESFTEWNKGGSWLDNYGNLEHGKTVLMTRIRELRKNLMAIYKDIERSEW